MTHTSVSKPADLLDLVGTPLGISEWHEITQDRVNLFAEATDDHQWIHVDPARAATGPFGTTIAHGYLTLSMASLLLAEVVRIEHVEAAVNYGLNRVRFPAPLPVNGRIRGAVTLRSAEQRPTGVEAVFEMSYELEHADRPVCIAEIVSLFR